MLFRSPAAGKDRAGGRLRRSGRLSDRDAAPPGPGRDPRGGRGLLRGLQPEPAAALRPGASGEIEGGGRGGAGRSGESGGPLCGRAGIRDGGERGPAHPGLRRGAGRAGQHPLPDHAGQEMRRGGDPPDPRGDLRLERPGGHRAARGRADRTDLPVGRRPEEQGLPVLHAALLRRAADGALRPAPGRSRGRDGKALRGRPAEHGSGDDRASAR